MAKTLRFLFFSCMSVGTVCSRCSSGLFRFCILCSGCGENRCRCCLRHIRLDITDMSIEVLNDNISYVSQEQFLFNTTLYDNILIGKPDATRDEVI